MFNHKTFVEKILMVAALLIIMLGIILRVKVWLLDRNLLLDEVNVARNVYERDFIGLARVLDYEQFAPPVFLWALKICGLIAGYSGKALRFYPLICGIGTLVMMWRIMREYITYKALWYPLFMLATAHWFLRYSTEVKQYMPDAFIVLSLIWLALKVDILKKKPSSFFVIWLVAGTIAIWASMPAVFALAGVGLHYLVVLRKERDSGKFKILASVGVIWIVQFAIYFFLILKDQMNSKFLQTGHANFFLFATPENEMEWQHNWDVFMELMCISGGFGLDAVRFNMLMLIAGLAFVFRKRISKSVLVLVPLMLPIMFAMFNKFTLMPRVVVFMMPLLLIVVGWGMDAILNIRELRFMKASGEGYKVNFIPAAIVVFIMAVFNCDAHDSIAMAGKEPFLNEELTMSIDYLREKGLRDGQINIHYGARPAYIYYTTISPDSNMLEGAKHAHILFWNVNYDSLAQAAPDKFAIVFTNVTEKEVYDIGVIMRRYADPVDSMVNKAARSETYIFQKTNPHR